MVQVIINEREPLEKAIRRFKKKFEKSGILKDVKRNVYYIKPSEEKRMKKARAMKRLRRTVAMQNNQYHKDQGF